MQGAHNSRIKCFAATWHTASQSSFPFLAPAKPGAPGELRFRAAVYYRHADDLHVLLEHC